MSSSSSTKAYYKKISKNIEIIDIIQHYPFNIANAMKYIFRLYRKTNDVENAFSDLKKAKYYIEKAILNGDGYIYSENSQKMMIAKNNATQYIAEFGLDNTHIPKNIGSKFGLLQLDVLQLDVLELLSGLTNTTNHINKDEFTKNISILEESERMIERMIEIITEGDNYWEY